MWKYYGSACCPPLLLLLWSPYSLSVLSRYFPRLSSSKTRRTGIIQHELSPSCVWAGSALARLLADNETNFQLFFHNDRSFRPPLCHYGPKFQWENFRWGISRRWEKRQRPTLSNRNFPCNKGGWDIAASACPNSALTQLHTHKILGKQNNNMKLKLGRDRCSDKMATTLPTAFWIPEANNYPALDVAMA